MSIGSRSSPLGYWKRLGILRVPFSKRHHVVYAGAYGVDILDITADHMTSKHVAECGVFPSGDEHRQILLRSLHEPAVLGVDLMLEFIAQQNAVHELMWEKSFTLLIAGDPFLQHGFFDPPHGFHFGNAGIGDAVHMAVQKGHFIRSSQITIVGHTLVVVVRDQIEDILFKIGAGAADRMNLVLPYHLRQREAQLSGAHSPRDRHKHAPSLFEMSRIGVGRILQCGGIEMAVVVFNELGDGTLGHWKSGLVQRNET